MKKQIIAQSLTEARNTLAQFLSNPKTIESISEMVDVMASAIKQGGKIMSCGNGGSLCDAMHFAEELTGRFRRNRRPLPAMAINDAAYITCTSNDYSYDEVFARWVEAFGRPEDVLLAISTSGRSENVLRAVQMAHTKGMKVVALTCNNDNPLRQEADVAVCAPCTPYSDRIQEIHIKVIHISIEALEAELEVYL